MESQKCISCDAYSNKCPHWCSSCVQHVNIKTCFLCSEAEAEKADVKADVTEKKGCYSCTAFPNNCPHLCTSCFQEQNLTSCSICIEAEKAEVMAEAKEKKGCYSCTAFPNQCTHFCDSCFKEEKLTSCPFCDEAVKIDANAIADKDEVEVKTGVTVKPRKIKMKIPYFEDVPALEWPDRTFSTTSAVMKNKPRTIDEISMQNPFCMLIALFVANILFFVKCGYHSPYQLVKFVENNLNLPKGQMLDVRTVHLLEDIFKVNVDIRFKRDGDNYNVVRNNEWETLNPVVLENNHYVIDGLDT